MRASYWICGFVFVVGAAVGTGWAQTPVGTVFTYQGRLKLNGAPANGPIDVRFTLWDSEGQQVGGEGAQFNATVTASDGLFTAEVDSSAFGLDAFIGQARWLEIAVRSPAGSGDFTTVGPRQPINPVPYALYALFAPAVTNADTVDGIHATYDDDPQPFTLLALDSNAKFPSSVLYTGSGSNLNADRLDGLDSTAFLKSIPVPLSLSHTTGETIKGSNTGGVGVLGTTTAIGSSGVRGEATLPSGTAYGVFGSSSSIHGIGVRGEAQATTGTCSGGSFTTASSSGFGIRAVAASNTGDTYAGWFENRSSTGMGVLTRVFGTDATALQAETTASTGVPRAIHAKTSAPGGNAIFAEASGTGGGHAGFFTNNAGTTLEVTNGAISGGAHCIFASIRSPEGAAIYGSSSSEAYGVHAVSATGIALKAESNNGNGMAISASGDVVVGGDLYVQDKFRLPTGAQDNYVLTTDLVGNASWKPAPGSLWASAGTDIVSTNTGNVGIGTSTPDAKLTVAGDTRIAGNLSVGGTINGSIHVSQITGLLGGNLVLQFPDVLDNSVKIEFEGVNINDPAVIINGPGYQIERVPGFGPNGPDDQPGFSMEFPLVLELGGTDAANMKAHFDQYLSGQDPYSHSFSIIIRDLAGFEVWRINGFEFIPQSYEPAADGRTRFTLVPRLGPDNLLNWEFNDDYFGMTGSNNPATDKRVEIASVTQAQFFPQVEVDEAARTLTFTYDFAEGKGIEPWVVHTIQGQASKESLSVITEQNGMEVYRRNYHGCFPMRFQILRGFNLPSKIKAQLVLSFDRSEDA